MTRETIELFRKIILPRYQKALRIANYEGMGETDAKEFKRDFNEILDLATKALEQEPRIGHWVLVEKTNTYSKWKCSEYGMLVITTQTPWYKHCPMCGLKMIEPQESEEV